MRGVIQRLVARPWWLGGLLVGVIVVAGGIFLGGRFVAQASHDFSDVSTGAFFHESVGWAKDREVTVGCGGGNFCPSNATKRGEMVVFLDRAADVFTPAIIDTTEAVGAVDMDVGVILCPTAGYAPSYPQQAVMAANGAIISAAAAPFVSLSAWGVYSTDGGANWTGFDPVPITEHDSPGAGFATAISYAGHADLVPGNNYMFGLFLISLFGTTGDATPDADSVACDLMVEILNREPEAAVTSAYSDAELPPALESRDRLDQARLNGVSRQ